MLAFMRDFKQVMLSMLHISEIFDDLLHRVNMRKLDLILERSYLLVIEKPVEIVSTHLLESELIDFFFLNDLVGRPKSAYLVNQLASAHVMHIPVTTFEQIPLTLNTE